MGITKDWAIANSIFLACDLLWHHQRKTGEGKRKRREGKREGSPLPVPTNIDPHPHPPPFRCKNSPFGAYSKDLKLKRSNGEKILIRSKRTHFERARSGLKTGHFKIILA
jgi:hypothetical protein